jgi:hypothetical protein
MVWEGGPAGAEDQIDPALWVDRTDDAGRELGARFRPAELPIERDPVFVARSRLEPVDADQGKVVPVDAEGSRAVVEHLDLAAVIRLHPDNGLGVGDKAKDRTEDQLGHPHLALGASSIPAVTSIGIVALRSGEGSSGLS